MADENEGTSPEEQALADEWAAALAEAGDTGQDDIDALMNQGGAAAPAAPRMAMEEFGAAPKPGNGPVALEGPNLDVILDIPVSEIRVGMHVEIVWAPESERSVDDIDNRSRGSGGDAIRGWRPTGEPDEPAELYLERMM